MQEGGKTLHKLYVLGMNDDMCNIFRGLALELC